MKQLNPKTKVSSGVLRSPRLLESGRRPLPSHPCPVPPRGREAAPVHPQCHHPPTQQGRTLPQAADEVCLEMDSTQRSFLWLGWAAFWRLWYRNVKSFWELGWVESCRFHKTYGSLHCRRFTPQLYRLYSDYSFRNSFKVCYVKRQLRNVELITRSSLFLVQATFTIANTLFSHWLLVTLLIPSYF